MKYVFDKLSGVFNSNCDSEYRIFNEVNSSNNTSKNSNLLKEKTLELSKERKISFQNRVDIYLQLLNRKNNNKFNNSIKNNENIKEDEKLKINFEELNSMFGLKFRDCSSKQIENKVIYSSNLIELKIKLNMIEDVEYYIKYDYGFSITEIFEQDNESNNVIFYYDLFLSILEKFEQKHINSKHFDLIKNYLVIYKTIVFMHTDLNNSYCITDDIAMNLFIVNKSINKTFNLETTLINVLLFTHDLNKETNFKKDIFLLKQDRIFYTSCIESFSNFNDAYSRFYNCNMKIIDSYKNNKDKNEISDDKNKTSHISKLYIMGYPYFLHCLANGSLN